MEKNILPDKRNKNPMQYAKCIKRNVKGEKNMLKNNIYKKK